MRTYKLNRIERNFNTLNEIKSFIENQMFPMVYTSEAITAYDKNGKCVSVYFTKVSKRGSVQINRFGKVYGLK